MIVFFLRRDYKLLNHTHNAGIDDAVRQQQQQRTLPSTTSAPFKQQQHVHSPIALGPTIAVAEHQQHHQVQQTYRQNQNQNLPNAIGFNNTAHSDATVASLRNLSPRERTAFAPQQEQQASLLPNQHFAQSPSSSSIPAPGNTTAQDLLNNVLGFGSRTARSAASTAAVTAASPAVGGPAFGHGLSPMQSARHIGMSNGPPGSPLMAMTHHQQPLQQQQQQQQAPIPLKPAKMQTGSIWSSTNMELGESPIVDVGGMGTGAIGVGVGVGLMGNTTAVAPPMRAAASGSGSTPSLMPPTVMSMQGTTGYPSAPDLSPYAQKMSLAPGHGRSLSGSGSNIGVGIGMAAAGASQGMGMGASPGAGMGMGLGANTGFRSGEGASVGAAVGGSTSGRGQQNMFGAIGQVQPQLQERRNLQQQQHESLQHSSFDPLLLQQQQRIRQGQVGQGHGHGRGHNRLGSASGSRSGSGFGIGSDSALALAQQQVVYDTRLGGGLATSIGAGAGKRVNGNVNGGFYLGNGNSGGDGIGIGVGVGVSSSTSPTHLQTQTHSNSTMNQNHRDYGIGNGTGLQVGSAGSSGFGPIFANGNLNSNLSAASSIGDLNNLNNTRARLYGMSDGGYDARGTGTGGDAAFGIPAGYGILPGQGYHNHAGQTSLGSGLGLGGNVNVMNGNPTATMMTMTAGRNGLGSADAYRRSLWET